MTLLFRNLDKRVEIRSSREGPLDFRHASEAAHYLRRSSNRPGVIALLRRLLSEHHHVQVWRLSDDAVIDEVARRLVNGSLQLLEMIEPRDEVHTEHPPAEAPAEEPVEVTQPPPAKPVPEEVLDLQAETGVETQPDLAAGVEAAEPPEMELNAEVRDAALDVGAKIEAPPALATEAGVAEPPIVNLAAEIGETPILKEDAKVRKPPAVETVADSGHQAELKSDVEVEAPAKPEAAVEAEKPASMKTKAEVQRPAAPDVEIQVGPETAQEDTEGNKPPPRK